MANNFPKNTCDCCGSRFTPLKLSCVRIDPRHKQNSGLVFSRYNPEGFNTCNRCVSFLKKIIANSPEGVDLKTNSVLANRRRRNERYRNWFNDIIARHRWTRQTRHFIRKPVVHIWSGTERLWWQLDQQDGKCAFCCTALDRENYSIDHWIPKFRMGYERRANHPKNLVWCCMECNQTKSYLTGEEFFEMLRHPEPFDVPSIVNAQIRYRKANKLPYEEFTKMINTIKDGDFGLGEIRYETDGTVVVSRNFIDWNWKLGGMLQRITFEDGTVTVHETFSPVLGFAGNGDTARIATPEGEVKIRTFSGRPMGIRADRMLGQEVRWLPVEFVQEYPDELALLFTNQKKKIARLRFIREDLLL